VVEIWVVDTDPLNSGTLPFLTHGQQTVTSLSSIIKYISSLEGDTFKTVNADAGLNSFEASQKAAWCSHVEAKLGDLVVGCPSAIENFN
jgi:sorting and assembly machinery component 37